MRAVDRKPLCQVGIGVGTIIFDSIGPQQVALRPIMESNMEVVAIEIDITNHVYLILGWFERQKYPDSYGLNWRGSVRGHGCKQRTVLFLFHYRVAVVVVRTCNRATGTSARRPRGADDLAPLHSSGKVLSDCVTTND